MLEEEWGMSCVCWFEGYLFIYLFFFKKDLKAI